MLVQLRIQKIEIWRGLAGVVFRWTCLVLLDEELDISYRCHGIGLQLFGR